MPSEGLMIAGGIGQGLQAGVDSFMRGADLNLRRQQTADEKRNRLMQLGLLARKEGLLLDAESGDLTDSDHLLKEREATTAKRDLDRRKTEADIRVADAHARAYDAAAKKGLLGGAAKPSVGQQAVDRKYGKDYAERISGGGYSAAQKKLTQLDDAISRLEKSDTASGGVVGLLPKFARDIFTPEGASIQDEVEQVAQESMKQILGGQFTEREGAGILKRAYNPRQNEKENATRVKRLRAQLAKALDLQKSGDEYFGERGTLQGFTGPLVESGADINLDADTAAPAAGGWSPDKEARLQELRRKMQGGGAPKGLLR